MSEIISCPECYGGHWRPCQVCGDTGQVEWQCDGYKSHVKYESQLQAETERRWKAECLLGEAIALLKLRDANPDLITFKDFEAYKQKYQDKP